MTDHKISHTHGHSHDVPHPDARGRYIRVEHEHEHNHTSITAAMPKPIRFPHHRPHLHLPDELVDMRRQQMGDK